MWRFPPTAAWASPPSCVPRTWSPWRTWSTAGSSAIRSRYSATTWASWCSADRRAGALLHACRSAWSSRRIRAPPTFPPRGSNSVTVIDIKRLLAFVRAASPAERPRAGQRSFGVRPLCRRAHSGGPRSQGSGALARRRAALRRQSAGRHHFRHRHRRAQVTRTISLGRPRRTHARAPRRAPVLRRALRLPRQLQLRQLPPGVHLRRPAMGSRAGWLRQGYRG